MTSENVKITIQEIDNTMPAGKGDGSSDIAFVPGFSVIPDGIKNVPVVCADITEFEKAFGKEPRRLTTKDIVGYEDLGFVAGDFDRSYVYAKELLYQGMSVIYSNIAEEDDSNLVKVEIAEPRFSDGSSCSFDVNQDDAHKTIVNATAIANVAKSDAKFSGLTKFSIPGDKTPVIKTFELNVTSNSSNASILNVAITKVEKSSRDGKSKQSSAVNWVSFGSNQIDITNKEETTLDVNVYFEVTLKLDCLTGDTFQLYFSEATKSCLTTFYNKVATQYDMLRDKNEYSVKYITSGGYPNLGRNCLDAEGGDSTLAFEILDVAASRGDAVGLVDYHMTSSVDLFDLDEESVYKNICEKVEGTISNETLQSFGAAMYPWAPYTCGSTLGAFDNSTIYMPASFGYLMCVAKAIKRSPNWLAMAGVTRGLVPNIKGLYTKGVLTNTIAEEMQPKFGVPGHNISVNCITNVRPYGLTLWGNRTLKPVSKDGTVALNFLNTRNMVSDIKKILYSTAKSLMFEQNSDTLWLRFKSGVSPLLNQLKTGNGISDFKIIRGTTKYNGDPLTKGEISAVIKIYPIHAVEYFELTVEINEDDVVVS